jgi:hypothetical protein
MTAPVIVIDLQTGMFDGKLEPVIHGAEALVAKTRAVLIWAYLALQWQKRRGNHRGLQSRPGRRRRRNRHGGQVDRRLSPH